MRKTKRKSRRSKNRDASNDWMGKLLLELVGIVAILFMLFVSNGDRQTSVKPEHVDYKAADIGAAITGYFSDQIDRQFDLKSP